MSAQPNGDRDKSTGAPARETAGQQASAATDRWADDHLIRGYN